MSIKVTPLTLPAAGTDDVDITIEETYEVDGVGVDTVVLRGRLVSERTVPLLAHGTTSESWDTSTVVARFTKLDLYGESKVFGPVLVKLDDSVPAFGVVTAARCQAAMPVEVSMPNHGLVLRSEEPIQLHSTVTTVPPIGDEKTTSVKPVRLIDTRSDRAMGKLNRAIVQWRDLKIQTLSLQKDRLATRSLSLTTPDMEGRLDRVSSQIETLMAEVQAIRRDIGRA